MLNVRKVKTKKPNRELHKLNHLTIPEKAQLFQDIKEVRPIYRARFESGEYKRYESQHRPHTFARIIQERHPDRPLHTDRLITAAIWVINNGEEGQVLKGKLYPILSKRNIPNIRPQNPVLQQQPQILFEKPTEAKVKAATTVLTLSIRSVKKGWQAYKVFHGKFLSANAKTEELARARWHDKWDTEIQRNVSSMTPALLLQLESPAARHQFLIDVKANFVGTTKEVRKDPEPTRVKLASRYPGLSKDEIRVIARLSETEVGNQKLQEWASDIRIRKLVDEVWKEFPKEATPRPHHTTVSNGNTSGITGGLTIVDTWTPKISKQTQADFDAHIYPAYRAYLDVYKNAGVQIDRTDHAWLLSQYLAAGSGWWTIQLSDKYLR